MNFLHRFDFSWLHYSHSEFSFQDVAPFSSAPRTQAPHTQNLPQVDKVELFKLKKQGDVWTGEFTAQKTVMQNEAEKVAQLWRKQSFVSESPICHNPGYAIRFYNRDKLLIYATLCWECDNIEFLTPKLEKYIGFNGGGIKGQKLLKYLEATLADVR